MAKRQIKVLFFIADTIATDEENEAIESYGGRHFVCVRNASMIGDKDAIESFDLVGGLVPPQYAAVAAAKGPPVEAVRPVTKAASAPKGSPLAPPVVEPEAEPAPAAKASKPVTPAPKPDAAKGWKPNA